MVVDIHAHIAPQPFLEHMKRRGSEIGVEVHEDANGSLRFSTGHRTGAAHSPLLSDAAARIAFMDEQGIDVQVVSPWVELMMNDLPGASGELYSMMLNEAMATEVSWHPERLKALGSVPLQTGGVVAARVLRRAVKEFGLAGVQIGTRINGAALSDPDLFPFWEEAQALNTLVFVHPHHTSELTPSGLPILEFVVANPADTTIALADLIFSGVLQRFPGLRMCLSHGGGFLAWQIGRMDSAWHRMNPDAPWEHSPSGQLNRLFVDSIVHGPNALDYLRATMGSERILLGTDYPFPLGDLEPLSSIKRSSLAVDPHFTRVSEGNARQLLAS